MAVEEQFINTLLVKALRSWKEGKKTNCRVSPLLALLQIKSSNLMLSSATEHLLQSPFPQTHLKSATQIFSKLPSTTYSLLYPTLQLKQALPRNPQATLTREANRLCRSHISLLQVQSPSIIPSSLAELGCGLSSLSNQFPGTN